MKLLFNWEYVSIFLTTFMQGLINITNEEKRKHRREYERNYYHNVLIPNGYAQKRKTYTDKGVSKKQQFINQFKNPCQKCGITDKDIIEFHHVDPSAKKFNLGSAVWKTNQAIEAEAAKCVCLPIVTRNSIVYMECIQTIQLSSYLNSYIMTRITYMETAAISGGF